MWFGTQSTECRGLWERESRHRDHCRGAQRERGDEYRRAAVCGEAAGSSGIVHSLRAAWTAGWIQSPNHSAIPFVKEASSFQGF